MLMLRYWLIIGVGMVALYFAISMFGCGNIDRQWDKIISDDVTQTTEVYCVTLFGVPTLCAINVGTNTRVEVPVEVFVDRVVTEIEKVVVEVPVEVPVEIEKIVTRDVIPEDWVNLIAQKVYELLDDKQKELITVPEIEVIVEESITYIAPVVRPKPTPVEPESQPVVRPKPTPVEPESQPVVKPDEHIAVTPKTHYHGNYEEHTHSDDNDIVNHIGVDSIHNFKHSHHSSTHTHTAKTHSHYENTDFGDHGVDGEGIDIITNSHIVSYVEKQDADADHRAHVHGNSGEGKDYKENGTYDNKKTNVLGHKHLGMSGLRHWHRIPTHE